MPKEITFYARFKFDIDVTISDAVDWFRFHTGQSVHLPADNPLINVDPDAISCDVVSVGD